jgi:uncharacterized phage protein (TIGR02216 family)
MAEVKPFPWVQAMQFAFGILHLSPRAFWSMTMHELNCAMRIHSANGSRLMRRDELDQLMQKHPDKIQS